MHNELATLINGAVSGANACVINPPEDGAGDSSILVDASKIFEVCEFLKSNDQYPFPVLQVISGVDYTQYLEVCYILASFNLKNSYQVIIKTRVTDRENAQLQSVVPVWAAANFQERECYDMIGVSFKDHPDHRRILCPDDWEGFPLRKDYEVQKVYRGMEVNPEGKMNFEDREFEVRKKEMEADLLKRQLERGH